MFVALAPLERCGRPWMTRGPVTVDLGEPTMATDKPITREQLIAKLNEDLAREYQAIIAYVVYSQVLKGAAVHEHREGAGEARRRGAAARADHRQADRLPRRHADGDRKPVKLSEDAEEHAARRPRERERDDPRTTASA